MLKFHTARYKNFLATGNAWNGYQLDKHSHTLILGINGTGKSACLDAICYGLYGKAFRNINKPQLINSINEKNMLVEITFTTQNNQYLVRRGMKPNIFEIICNGTAIPEFPSSAEMQEYLERYILKCNFKAFTQVVILGASSYVPFMRLTPAARREILEDILDIEVFSVMHSLVKEMISGTKDDLNKAQNNVTIIESQLALMKSYADNWRIQQEERRAAIDQQIRDCQHTLSVLNQKLATVIPNEDSWRVAVAKLSEWQEKRTKATKLTSRFATERQHLMHNQKFFTDHDQCPTCQQIIETGFKAAQITSSDEALVKVTSDMEEVQKAAASLDKKIAAAKEADKYLREIESNRRTWQIEIDAVEKETLRLNKERQKTFEESPQVTTELVGNIDDAKDMVRTLMYQKQVQEHGSLLLKDSGIRTSIIKQYLPVINKYINYYLHALNFNIAFSLDETFTETIKSRGRDEFTYESFSEGEKRRIDLALVLTWRAIARLKNSVHSNLIFFDEIFDSSLDVSGTDDFLALLPTLGPDTNVFVISHKSDVLIDRFPHTITVTKEKGFSVVPAA